MKPSRLRFGLRFKLLLMSGFLFAIPMLGYEYVWEMEKYLRIGQEKTLMGTVRAVATALHERPTLFDSQASYLPSVQQGRDLYAYPINNPIRLDGQLNDWQDKQRALEYSDDYIIEGKGHYNPDSLRFKHMVGKYKNYLYSYFEVIDEEVIYRPKNTLKVDVNDLLQLAFVTQSGEFKRYLIATSKEGWLTPFELKTDVDSNVPLQPEPRIQGAWRQTAQGYNIELRIPLDFLGSQLSFAITDFDKHAAHQQKVTLGTADFKNPDKLGTILVPSPEIAKIVKGLGHTQSRIWVVDQHSRVLAQSGDIKYSAGLWGQFSTQAKSESWFSPVQDWLSSIYYQILTKPPTDFTDVLYDEAQLQGSHIHKALKGEAATTWRLTTDRKALILSAAHPIISDGAVMGAVIAEETTNGIRTLRNQALEKLFNVILAVMVLGTLALFLFASRISFRIRALRNQTETAIDEQGKILHPIAPTKASDEIGDLQRSFADMVERLGQYTQYLQGMSSRLSHELRTPVAVVRSSLESLSMDSEQAANSVYMQRAQEGVSRLSTILTMMSEATRLEQTIANNDKVSYPILEVVNGCVQGYQLMHPKQKFEMIINVAEQTLVNGVPELFAQLLDKLVANAMEFAQVDSAIVITAQQENENVLVIVANQGPLLPAAMQHRLFDSMVSVRSDEKQEQPHLGLGLYIARLIAEFHNGSIVINNNELANGVDAIVTIPLANSAQN
ncbi:proteobacterial dedicated sortase system histidine kinase [Saccharobesus litoralis]|uniref:histidine kinase n=1 Tax=Saccharobesus litoralis TaxID=2172099 RepID=A0A2S0VSE8_9ALTE|nr:proteobacterial dedicated sortase system histidine kinase [Saccharobesus litoralis]AWB67146.1 proteobacterial dedicated sortase system histidine kinase [Saccharobesus litoralis]